MADVVLEMLRASRGMKTITRDSMRNEVTFYCNDAIDVPPSSGE